MINVSDFLWIAYSQVFDSGAFSEDSTLLLTDWLAHVPEEGKILF